MMNTILEYLISFLCLGIFIILSIPTYYGTNNLIKEGNKYYVMIASFIVFGILFNAIFIDLRTEMLSWFGIVSYGVEYQ